MQPTRTRIIQGTPVFDGAAAARGYALNAMCYSFNSKSNRDAFAADEEAYMRRFGLNDVQADAVRGRDVTALIQAGGNIYYLAKLTGILGLSVQDVGAAQTGMTLEAFRRKLLDAATED